MDGRDEMEPTSATKLTYDDLVSFPDDGQRHELIDGEHYVTPAPATKHQRVSRNLLLALGAHLVATGQGEVFAAPFDIILSPHDVVEPDLLVILRDQAHILTDRHVCGAPSIVIEILSPGTRRRDEILKRRLYDRAGVIEYWLVDPDADAVVVTRRTSTSAFIALAALAASAGDVLTCPLLPGFSAGLASLFAAPPR